MHKHRHDRSHNNAHNISQGKNDSWGPRYSCGHSYKRSDTMPGPARSATITTKAAQPRDRSYCHSTATAKVTAKQWWKTKSTAFRCWPSLWSWGGIAGSRLTAIPYGTSKLRSSFVAKVISTSIPDWSKLNPTMHQNPRKIGPKINP